jgi:hypothetical protein
MATWQTGHWRGGCGLAGSFIAAANNDEGPQFHQLRMFT